MVTILSPGFAPSCLDYTEGWILQRTVHAAVVAGDQPNSIVLCEHNSVYTAGTRTEDQHRPTGDIPVVDVDRGGSITWHGPGQLVGYPIVRLPDAKNVVGFVRLLEGAIMLSLSEFGIQSQRVKGRSGVWVEREGTQYKVAAIGLRVASGVTMHGFAINCSNSLDAYEHITACGISDAGVTTVSSLAGQEITPKTLAPVVRKHLIAALADFGITETTVPAFPQPNVTHLTDTRHTVTGATLAKEASA